MTSHRSPRATAALLVAAAACATCLPRASRAQAADQPRFYSGAVGSVYPIYMLLHRSGERYSGWYAYERAPDKLRLTGQAQPSGAIELAETDASGRKTGSISARLDVVGALRGTWSSPDGKRRLPFEAEEVRNPFDGTWTSSSGMFQLALAINQSSSKVNGALATIHGTVSSEVGRNDPAPEFEGTILEDKATVRLPTKSSRTGGTATIEWRGRRLAWSVASASGAHALPSRAVLWSQTIGEMYLVPSAGGSFEIEVRTGIGKEGKMVVQPWIRSDNQRATLPWQQVMNDVLGIQPYEPSDLPKPDELSLGFHASPDDTWIFATARFRSGPTFGYLFQRIGPARFVLGTETAFYLLAWEDALVHGGGDRGELPENHKIEFTGWSPDSRYLRYRLSPVLRNGKQPAPWSGRFDTQSLHFEPGKS